MKTPLTNALDCMKVYYPLLSYVLNVTVSLKLEGGFFCTV